MVHKWRSVWHWWQSVKRCSNGLCSGSIIETIKKFPWKINVGKSLSKVNI
jgi:predicted dinucleotide-utilizing enzyme